MSRDIRNSSKINIDTLFPSVNNKSGSRGKKMDIETLFSHTAINEDPIITFTSDILVNKIVKRRKEKLKYYKQMLKYCYNRINEADDDLATDILFSVIENFPECKEYNPRECLEYISVKLREECFDTAILSNTTMFITWKYIEIKKEDKKSTGHE